MITIDRKEYLQTVTYKMVVILGSYRRLMSLTGAEIAEDIRRLRAESDEHFEYVFDKNFIIFCESGFTQLKREEAYRYAHYIAQALNYPEEQFIKSVEFEAEAIGDLSLSFRQNDRKILNALAAITLHMNNFMD